MKLLLIYYNPNHNCFYFKLVNDVTNFKYEVGYVNKFGHQLVQIFYVRDKKFISCHSYWEYLKSRKDLNEPKFNKVIDRIVDVLYKFKKK